MINGKSAELRTGQTYQSGVYFVAEGKTFAANSKQIDRKIWDISNTGISLYQPGQRDQRETGHTGKFCGVYCKAATYVDQANKEAVRIQRVIDQQSGLYCAGRIFSQKGSCQKRRNKLRYRLPTTGCGNKNSHRHIISLSRPISRLFSPHKLLLN